MSKTLALVAAGALTLAAPSSALTQTFWPTNSTSTLSGTLYIEDTSQAFECDVTIEVDISPGGVATIIDVDFSSPTNIYCGTVVQPIPVWSWAITPGSSGGFVDLTLGFNTFSNACQGTVHDAYYSSAFGELFFDNRSLTSSWGPPCFIDGFFYADPPFYIL